MKCQICQEKFQTKHHIQSKVFEGKNIISNIAYLCASCHFKVHHSGEIIIEGNFLTSTGYQLIWHLKGEPSITGFEPEVHIW